MQSNTIQQFAMFELGSHLCSLIRFLNESLVLRLRLIKAKVGWSVSTVFQSTFEVQNLNFLNQKKKQKEEHEWTDRSTPSSP